MSDLRQRGEIERILRQAGLGQGVVSRTAQLHMLDRKRAAENDDGSFTWILTTEKPTVVWDWERWDFVEEILLADGMLVPANNQVVLLDSHSRSSVRDVLGHVEGFAEAESGGFAARSGAVFFAGDADSVNARAKVLERHITDGSVGYQQLKSVWCPEGEQVSIGGRIFEGPVRVTYQWLLREFSITPIGADVLAKVRLLCGA